MNKEFSTFTIYLNKYPSNNSNSMESIIQIEIKSILVTIRSIPNIQINRHLFFYKLSFAR